MSGWIALALALVVVAAPLAASARTPTAPPRELVQYGHVKSLVRKGRRFELRFDPALWLGGVTARRAAAQDGRDVSNDYYVVDEGHRLLTYLVPPTARVTVLTGATRATAITVSELAQIVKGRNPRRRPLFEPSAGFWIRTATDTVRALDQQYQP
jgi:hypothetical protein